MRTIALLCALTIVGLLVSIPAAAGASTPQGDTKSVETAVLAVHDAMTRAGEAADADQLFSYMAETDRGSVVQNGVVLATRQEALDAVRSNLRGISKIQYTWGRRLVTVLSPEIAVLVAEGVATVTTAAGDGFSAPLAQSVVCVLKDGAWKAVHAHNSSPRTR